MSKNESPVQTSGNSPVDSLSRACAILQASTLLPDEELCLNMRGRTLSCHACSAACPVEALDLSVDAIEVDDAACTRCGACLPVCPAGVMRLTSFDPQRFLQALGGEVEVHLHCSASQDQGGGVVIPCYRVLDARLLGAALADGSRTLWLHGTASCGDCDNGDARAWLDQLQQQLQQWFGESAPTLKIAEPGSTGAPGERVREDQPPMNRRNFLRFAGIQAADSAAGWFLPIEEGTSEKEALPFYLDDEEVKRPAAYQARLAARAMRLPWKDETSLPWRTRTLAEHCTACMICAQRCPTGALDAVEKHGARMISFEAALCTDCGLCERLCPEHAIRPREVLTPEDVVAPRALLLHRDLRKCRGCGQPYLPEPGGSDLCAICENEMGLDEEWLEMLQD